jgi:hypothetical protein
VTKGGSFLCHVDYCESYRPSARRGTPSHKDARSPPRPYHAEVPGPLDYAAPPPTRTPARYQVAAFLCVTLIVGCIYLVVGDFKVYVGTGPTRWPKFELPLSWRLAESAVVGALAASVVLITAGIARRWHRRN